MITRDDLQLRILSCMSMEGSGIVKYRDDALKEMSFTERMFFLTSILTNDGDIAEVIKASIVVIFLNADLLYIDLLWHIEQKMKYNELRENKHGKKY